ncbi:phage tail protein [Pseudomonas qingdaonensis]|uniref:phage tail protein n=1 Tax=Pseudomonas qingdaonensis TaxID=2056231 RepID=UPI002E1956BB|nr:phage tail protein [Pseudomonas qingdaonensis]
MVDQTSQFYAILTKVGAAKQANADALGIPWKITQMAVGDANPAGVDNPPLPMPDASWTSLLGEWRRAPLNRLKVDEKDNAVIVAEQVIPAEIGGRWIREVGLYDADGDLVAVANCAPTYKPLLSQGSGRTQVVRMNLVVSSSSNVALKIDPSVVLATREYVDKAREATELYARNQLKIHTDAANPHPQYLLRSAVANDVGPLTWLGDASGTANALALALKHPEAKLAAYAAGQRFQFRAVASNTGLVTVKINDLAAVAVKKAEDGALVDLLSGDIRAGALYDLSFDGTSFQLGSTGSSLDSVLRRSLRMGGAPITASTVLTDNQLGHVIVDAAVGALTVTLPSSSATLRGVEVTLSRKDITANMLSIAAFGAEKIVLPGTADGMPATELIFAGDYLTLRADGAGKWWCVGQAQLPASIQSGLVSYAAPGVYAFAVPPVLRAGRRIPSVTLTGGGGSGARSSTASGAGGSAGGTAIKRVSLTGLSSVTLTIAEGGLSRSTSNGSGYDGGTTSFGDIFSATGGGGGLSNGVGGPPGSGVGGDINIDGGRSGNLLAGFTPLNRAGGDGGASYWGGGSVSADSANPALAPGSGGGGAVSSSGKGADGIGKIEW